MGKITLQVAGRTVDIYSSANLDSATKNGLSDMGGANKNDAAGTGGAVKIVYLHIFDAAEGAAVFEKLGGGCLLAAISGCSWEDDFTPWPAPVYLSLGDKESRSKNARLQQNETALRAVAAAWEPHTLLKVELNPGGHFQDAELRTAKGIAWALGQL